MFVKVIKSLDKLTNSKSTKVAINVLIKKYGEMLDFKIDHKTRVISASILLKGEDKPVDIDIQKYKIVKEKPYAHIVIESMDCNKEWLNALAKQFIIKKPIKIPYDKVDLIEEFLS